MSIDLGSSTFKLPNGASKLFGDENTPLKGSNANRWETKACFTLGVKAKKNWGQLWAFLACCLAPRVANWTPKFDGILFPALGANTRP